MCGIVGYIGDRDATPIILNGLKKLEYRGYDSAGIAVISDGRINIRRSVGKIDRLIELVNNDPIHGKVGIGHTRWATHGKPSTKNAHPHIGATGKVVVVHNGIVENFLQLKEKLKKEGVQFHSDTDTEVIAHLVEKFLMEGMTLVVAVRKALCSIKGAHGIVVLSADQPELILAARIGNAGGVVIGEGTHEMFIASDVPAIMEHTSKVVFLESQQLAIVSKDSWMICDLDGKQVTSKVQSIEWDPVSAQKGEYQHFMQKEIHEQVRSLNDTLAGRVDFERGEIYLPELNLTPKFSNSISKIIITACGTASYVGMVGKILIERIARIPSVLEIASEFRYSDPIIPNNSVLLAVSQSGETADTLAAIEEGRKRGAKIWSIVNAIGSQAIRLADGFISMQAGPEIGVASTKAFTAPLLDLYMLAVKLADFRKAIDQNKYRELVQDLRLIPDAVGKCLDRESEVIKIAKKLASISNALFIGRGINMPIAYEGALKLKEISYIHAEAYPAGEMKHGPIALIDENMPVIAIVTKDPWYEKMVSQIEQAKARGGKVIAVATEGDDRIKDLCDCILWVPEVPWLLSPVINVLPLQLLAYHIATLRGLDVDQPRNLAKSVTVE
jgi:glucosamine--fructose-6-phosphate aminotransferase (isomerizing)